MMERRALRRAMPTDEHIRTYVRVVKRETICYDEFAGEMLLIATSSKDVLMQARIDYLRLIYRGDVANQDIWAGHIMDCVHPSDKAAVGDFKKHGRFFTVFDPTRKTMTKAFECWGTTADDVCQFLNPSHWDNITRLDFRREIPELPVELQQLYSEVEKRSNNARRSFNLHSSPKRTKEDGRDAGGKGLYIGSHGSSRRVAIYRRTGEKTAMECQFSRDGLKDIIARAKHMYYDQQVNLSRRDILAYVLLAASDDTIFDTTGHTAAEFEHNEMWSNQEQLFDSQESLLSLLDETYDKLDPESKLVFYESKISPEGYAITYVDPNSLRDEDKPDFIEEQPATSAIRCDGSDQPDYNDFSTAGECVDCGQQRELNAARFCNDCWYGF